MRGCNQISMLLIRCCYSWYQLVKVAPDHNLRATMQMIFYSSDFQWYIDQNWNDTCSYAGPLLSCHIMLLGSHLHLTIYFREPVNHQVTWRRLRHRVYSSPWHRWLYSLGDGSQFHQGPGHAMWMQKAASYEVPLPFPSVLGLMWISVGRRCFQLQIKYSWPNRYDGISGFQAVNYS